MPTEQQKAIGDRGRALKACYVELAEKYKSFEDKFIKQKKTGKGPGRKLYDCIEAKMAGK